MHTLKIFGELSKTPKSAETNMTSGLLPLVLRLLEEEDKFSKEVRIWALIIVNRGCMHTGIAHEFLDRVMKIDPPLFLEFLLHVSAIEDTDFTIHTRLVWQEIEKHAKAGSQSLYQQFLDNYPLIEKLAKAATVTEGSKSNIKDNIKNTIRHLATKHKDLQRMIEEATKH